MLSPLFSSFEMRGWEAVHLKRLFNFFMSMPDLLQLIDVDQGLGKSKRILNSMAIR